VTDLGEVRREPAGWRNLGRGRESRVRSHRCR
jgi:hypothetical protein